jgi:hypothetical protein
VRDTFLRRVEAPFPSPSKALKVLPTVLDIDLPFPLEGCIHRFLCVGRIPGGRVGALAVGARKDTFAARLAEARAAGVDPVVVDHDGLALWSQALAEGLFCEGVNVLLYAADDRSCLVAGLAGEILAAHAARAADPAQLARLVKVYGGTAQRSSPPERPAGSDASRNARPSAVRLIVCGPGASDTGLLDRVRAALGDRLSMETVTAGDPETFLARSLARRALQGDALACNFRAGELTHPALRKRVLGRVSRAATVLLLAGVALFAVGGAARRLAAARVRVADEVFAAMRDRIAGYPVHGAKGDQAIEIVRGAAAQRMSELRPFVDAVNPSATACLASVMEAAMRSGLRLDLAGIQRSRATLSGLAPDWDAPSALADRLRAFGYETTIDRDEATADERIPFRIEASRRGATHD